MLLSPTEIKWTRNWKLLLREGICSGSLKERGFSRAEQGRGMSRFRKGAASAAPFQLEVHAALGAEGNLKFTG
jgi:hypothetical protein